MEDNYLKITKNNNNLLPFDLRRKKKGWYKCALTYKNNCICLAGKIVKQQQ